MHSQAPRCGGCWASRCAALSRALPHGHGLLQVVDGHGGTRARPAVRSATPVRCCQYQVFVRACGAPPLEIAERAAAPSCEWSRPRPPGAPKPPKRTPEQHGRSQDQAPQRESPPRSFARRGRVGWCTPPHGESPLGAAMRRHPGCDTRKDVVKEPVTHPLVGEGVRGCHEAAVQKGCSAAMPTALPARRGRRGPLPVAATATPSRMSPLPSGRRRMERSATTTTAPRPERCWRRSRAAVRARTRGGPAPAGCRARRTRRGPASPSRRRRRGRRSRARRARRVAAGERSEPAPSSGAVRSAPAA